DHAPALHDRPARAVPRGAAPGVLPVGMLPVGILPAGMLPVEVLPRECFWPRCFREARAIRPAHVTRRASGRHSMSFRDPSADAANEAEPSPASCTSRPYGC